MSGWWRHFGNRASIARIALALSLFGATMLGRTMADEAIRDTPLAPEEELATFELADARLTVELVACEPQLDSPVAVAWDADGAMYVAEMIDYPLGPTAGRIRRLEDRDSDGRYEHATIFSEGLRFPNGVLAARGGVFVTAAPDLLFLRDTDGDGRADKQQVVLTGFGEGNQQLRANGLTWGLDHWIYGANGRSDGNIRHPKSPSESAVSIRAKDFRLRADGRAFEATSGSSQFGQASDDWGNRFLSWNTIPIRHALFDAVFLERNGRFVELGVRDINDPADTGQVFPKSPRPQTFNRERTDFFNALSGLTIYRGDALGTDYQGSVFVGESLTNLVHRRVLMPEGPSFVSRRGEHSREFLAARDPWFHPVYLTTGPDGALYVVDFYRRWVEHPGFVAEKLRAGVDWRQGVGHGRIWKISRRENTWPPRPAPKLTRATTVELVNHLNSANGWLRDTAGRVLVERNDPQSVPLLRALVAGSRLPPAKAHALSTLEVLGQLDDGTLLLAMEDGEPNVRQYAMKLATPRLATTPALATALMSMTDTSHANVRFQLALALGKIEGREKTAALVRLADAEYRDPLLSAAIVGSLGDSIDEFLTELVSKHTDWRRKPTADQMRFLSETAAIACAAEDSRRLVACLKLVAPPMSRQVEPGGLAVLAGAAKGLADRGTSLRALMASPHESLRGLAPQLAQAAAAARQMAVDEQLALEYRLAAIEVVGLVDTAGGAILVELIVPSNDPKIQHAAARALADPDTKTATAVFARWQELTTSTRRVLGGAALRSRSGLEALTGALEAEQILPRELDATIRDGLLAVRDEKLQARLKPLLASEASGESRQAVVERFEPLAERGEGNRTRGAEVFEKQCLICHSLQGRGERVGPDLSGIAARPTQSLVEDLFDPSRQVAPDYLAYTLVTREGQVLTGLVVAETAAGVTLRRADGAQDVVPRERIEELRGTGKSLMPEALEASLTQDQLADLFAFLADPDARLFAPQK